MNQLTRREFVKYAGMATATAAVPFSAKAVPSPRHLNQSTNPICIFSKHLQWLDFEDLGKYIKDVGFDGVDLTVRGNGHVEPRSVSSVLPDALDKIRKSGAVVPMMVTNVKDPDDPLTVPVLKTASENGIKFYRMQYYRWDDKGNIRKRLEELKPKVARLAQMNEQYGIHGAYQNHHGNYFVGSSIWDWWYVIKDMDPRWIGFQYDIRHAVVEAGLSWTRDFSLVKDFVRCTVAKDFLWAKNDEGAWGPKSVPLGTGMVNLTEYFQLYKDYGISGPISLHFEYPIYEEKMTKKEKMDFALKVMAKDIVKLRDHLADAGIVK